MNGVIAIAAHHHRITLGDHVDGVVTVIAVHDILAKAALHEVVAVATKGKVEGVDEGVVAVFAVDVVDRAGVSGAVAQRIVSLALILRGAAAAARKFRCRTGRICRGRGRP